MVLLIDGHVQSAEGVTSRNVVQMLCSNQTVISGAQSFKALPTVPIKDGSSVLYVCQGEMAIIPPTGVSHHRNVPRILASDDATSCCIIVLSSENYHAIAHLDCVQRVKSFFSEMDKFKALDSPTPIKLHIVGGFRDDYGIADQILSEIFTKVVLKSSETYELGICCVGDLNLREPTDPRSPAGPAVLGLSYDCASGSLNPSLVEWPARNPLAILRLSRLYSNDSTQSVINVFDHEQCCLTITPFSYLSYSLAKSPTISYEQLRSHSTTPEHEPPAFFEGSAAVHRLRFYYPNPLRTWFKEGPLKFALSDSNDDGHEKDLTWIPADEHSALVSNHPILTLPLSK